ncbi:MAG: hypothetical protein ABTQ34_09260 [Bdellovibrionales bacterium]
MPEDTQPVSESLSVESAKTCPVEQSRPCGRALLKKIALLLALVLVVGGGWRVWHFAHKERGIVFDNADHVVTESLLGEILVPLVARVEKLERFAQEFPAQGAGATGRLVRDDRDETSNSKTETRRDATLREELGQSRKDIAAMAAEIKTLKESLRQTGDSAVRSQHEFRKLMASAMALMRLREKAVAGYSFSQELSVARRFFMDTSWEQAQAVLMELDSYAAQGVPSLEALRGQLVGLSGPAIHAIETAQAQTWWQRVLAALQGLVSIRSEQGGIAAGALERVDAALASGDVSKAYTEIMALEPAAQDVLRDWSGLFLARVAVDRAIEKLIALSLEDRLKEKEAVKPKGGEADDSVDAP